MPVTRSHRIEIGCSLDRAFPLFTPKGEEDWVEGWAPHYIYPSTGETCEGMVFRTGDGVEETFWSCIHLSEDAVSRHVRYVRVTPASRFAFVDVVCRTIAENWTEATVTYTVTPLSPHGSAYMDALSDIAYRTMIEGWKDAIERHLDQGEAA